MMEKKNGKKTHLTSSFKVSLCFVQIILSFKGMRSSFANKILKDGVGLILRRFKIRTGRNYECFVGKDMRIGHAVDFFDLGNRNSIFESKTLQSVRRSNRMSDISRRIRKR